MIEVQFRYDNGATASCMAREGELLLDVVRRAGLTLDAPCSGDGTCGQCRVQVLSGEVREEDSLVNAPGYHLACRSRVYKPLTIRAWGDIKAFDAGIQAVKLSTPRERKTFKTAKRNLELTGMILSHNLDIIPVDMTAPTVEDSLPDMERLIKALNKYFHLDKVEIPCQVLQKLPGVLRENNFQVKCVVRTTSTEMFVYDVYGANEEVKICAAALDIGDKRVSGLLLNLEDGQVLAKARCANGQLPYGRDGFERIKEQSRPGGIQRLQDALVVDSINPLLRALSEKAGVPLNQIYRVCICASTVLCHLLTGVNASSMQGDPAIPAFLHTRSLFASSLGLCVHPDAYILMAPCVDARVGGGGPAGILASSLWNRPEYSLMVNLGASGELILGNEDFLIGATTSAGSIFEGGEIPCAMRVSPGAVEAVKLDWNTLTPTCRVVGGIKPLGLSGAGLIDLVSELLRVGVIDPKGKIIRQGRRILREEESARYVLAFSHESADGREISLTQEDLECFIKAKAAIYASIQTLLSSHRFYPDMIDDIYVTGEIGSGMNMTNAIRIGLLPDLPLEKLHYIGNASLKGAYMMLLSSQAEKKTVEFSQSIEVEQLKGTSEYAQEEEGALFLPHADLRAFPSLQKR